MGKRKPKTIDEYLAPLSAEKRATLEKLRRAIKAAAPKAEECIRYQVPAFRLDGRMLVVPARVSYFWSAKYRELTQCVSNGRTCAWKT
jgi:uncharacterized protein YdhG (YjbR/CyaY superfamily)